MAEPITLKIKKFDPSVDKEPYFVEYQVPVADDDDQVQTVLKCLNYIDLNIESVAYDSNCRWGGCGRCGMMVDGTPKLACWARVEPGETYTIEPLAGFEVIRDLVVDNSKAYDRFVQSDLSIRTYKPLTGVKDLAPEVYWGADDGSDEGKTQIRFERCRECTMCYSVCTALNVNKKWDKFIGPGAMMQIAQRYYDTLDESDRLSQAVFGGVAECVQCGACAAVCPAMIDIPRVNRELLEDAIERGLIDGTELDPEVAAYPFL